jgi:penicillin-binding protein 1A
MRAAHEHKPPSKFPRAAGVVTASIDKHSGKLAYPDDPDAIDEVFLAGTEPLEVSEPYVPDAGTVDATAAQ